MALHMRLAQHSTAQCSATQHQYSIVWGAAQRHAGQYSLVQFTTVQCQKGCCFVWRGALQHGLVQYSMVWFGPVRSAMVWFGFVLLVWPDKVQSSLVWSGWVRSRLVYYKMLP